MENCELFNLIPKDEINRVFTESETASAEMDFSFMGFEEVYKAVCMFVPKGKVILDLGCSYAPQSYYFSKYYKYIGVDLSMHNNIRFDRQDNCTIFVESIQDFINKRLKDLPYKNTDYFAICSYVPDREARKMVRETFENCLVYYPST